MPVSKKCPANVVNVNDVQDCAGKVYNGLATILCEDNISALHDLCRAKLSILKP